MEIDSDATTPTEGEVINTGEQVATPDIDPSPASPSVSEILTQIPPTTPPLVVTLRLPPPLLMPLDRQHRRCVRTRRFTPQPMEIDTTVADAPTAPADTATSAPAVDGGDDAGAAAPEPAQSTSPTEIEPIPGYVVLKKLKEGLMPSYSPSKWKALHRRASLWQSCTKGTTRMCACCERRPIARRCAVALTWLRRAYRTFGPAVWAMNPEQRGGYLPPAVAVGRAVHPHAPLDLTLSDFINRGGSDGGDQPSRQLSGTELLLVDRSDTGCGPLPAFARIDAPSHQAASLPSETQGRREGRGGGCALDRLYRSAPDRVAVRLLPMR